MNDARRTGPPPADAAGAPAMGERIAAFVARTLEAPPEAVRVEGLARMAGGASRELWSFDLALGEGAPGGARRLPLVLRRDPPGRSDESDRVLEAELLRAAEAGGVPVPHVHWACDDPAVLDTPFFVMDRLEGETLPRRLLRDAEYADAREGMASALGAILARVHDVDPGRPGLAGLERPGPDRAPGLDQLETTAEALRQLAPDPHPVLDLAERWLRERVPEPRRRTLVHGDYRVGNVLFGPEGPRAILDWELAHVGDPAEDLGWLCTKAWRFGSPLPAGGVGTREALLEAYEEAGGERVDPERLRFWEALGSFKVALVFVRQAWVHLSGRLASLELASLGRRTAEAEEALLEIMEGDA